MKRCKCALSVLLCCILLASFAPMVYAEDILIDKASAEYTVPAAGEAFDFNAISVPDGAHYTAKILDAYYYNGSNFEHIKSGDVVEKGIHCSVRIRFYADSGYRLQDATTEYSINGDVTKSIVGTNLVEVVFVAVEKAPSEPEAPVRPSFWKRVITFFLTLHSRIQHFFWQLRHLFGLI